MTDSATAMTNENLSIDSLACIDGIKLERVEAFREFLSSHGIIIHINSITDKECLYYIVAADSNEVKTIFSRGGKKASRTLILLFDDIATEALNLSLLFNAKVAVIGERLIEQEESRVIFGFLCGSSDSVIDLRTSKQKESLKDTPSTILISPDEIVDTTPRINTEIVEKNIEFDYWEKDEKRIEKVIENIYQTHPKKRKKGNVFQSLSRMILFSFSVYFFFHIFSIILSLGLFIGSIAFRNYPDKIKPLLIGSQMSSDYAHLSLQPLVTVLPISSLRMYERLITVLQESEMVFLQITELRNVLKPSTFFLNQPSEKNSVYAQILAVRSQGEKIKTNISLLEADIKVIKESSWVNFPATTSTLVKVEQYVDKAGELVQTVLQLSTLYPLMAPPGETRSYLLLFQNSNELRPTGGFIGSIGRAVMRNGIMDEVTIDDVYTYDGQLRGHVDPPLPIRTLLQKEHWYLRDSNWDPDFEHSGEKAAWFFEKSGGGKVDGTIAITLPFLQDLLKATGPIKIAETPERITSESLFPVLHKEIEENFFPGSTQKKDLLGSIFRKLLEEITQGNADPLLLSKAIEHSLETKTIQLYSRDKTTQQLLYAYKWAGTLIPSTSCSDGKTNSCTQDFLIPVEANLGVNKANEGVTRHISKVLKFSPSTLFSTDTISFSNTSGPSTPGGGDYTGYLRLYYPLKTSIKSISINGQEISFTEESMTPKQIPYVEFLQENALSEVIGVAFTVPSTKNTEIVVIQEQPINAALKEYKFSFRNQPGTGIVPLQVKGVFPESTSLKRAFEGGNEGDTATFIAVSNNFEYTTRTDSDSSIVVSAQNHE